MNRNFILSTMVCLLLLSCTTKKSFYEVKVDNPAFIPDSAFSGCGLDGLCAAMIVHVSAAVTQMARRIVSNVRVFIV